MRILKSFFSHIIIIGFLCASIVTPVASSKSYTPPEGFADLVEPLMPAVVNVFMTHKPKRSAKNTPFPEGSPFNEFQQFFEKFMAPPMEPNPETFESKRLIPLGSGFIIDKTGYIVTNYHVVAEASNKVAVKLMDGTELKAKVIGHDKKTDLALIKVNYNKPLPYVEFGDSEKSRVGDWVIAIGNPFGIGITVTSGIISANGRDIASDGIVDNFIQTDAAINRGNSGGPMFNMEGKVIGVNTAILSTVAGGNIGIGFATPASLAQDIIQQLKKSGKVRRGKLGIRMQAITNDIAESMSLDNKHGVLVVEVIDGSAADKAGLKVGDVIVAFDHNKVKTLKELARIIGGATIGKPLPFQIIRKGKKVSLEATLTEDQESIVEHSIQDSDQELPKEKYSEFSPQEILGAQFATLTPELRNKFGVPLTTDGVIILNMTRKSVWYARGLKPGDVVISANQSKIDSATQLNRIIKSAKFARKKSILLLVSRKEYQFFAPIPLHN
ncbi:MAG: Do family serine endopeptidase [Alphaproteobacteria bacterium]|nr:Do family serine endopeptidase [Alphaproteobacteria bacterium]